MNMLKSSCHSSQSDIHLSAARRAEWGITDFHSEGCGGGEHMLPANVILTNRLINSSEAKDNSKVMQPR